MKKLVLACLLLLLSGAFWDGYAQTTNVFSRSEVTTGYWWHSFNPWIRGSDNIQRPDLISGWNVPPNGTIGRTNVFIGHNNNRAMTVNDAWFQLASLTLQSTADQNRTFALQGTGGISISTHITNLSTALHTFNVPIGVDGTTVTFDAGTTSGDRFVFDQTIFVNANIAAFIGTGNIAVNGVMSGAGGRVTKDGTGTLTLSGNNTYTGSTTLTAGTLLAGHNNAFGTGTLILSGGTLASRDATARTFANTVSINGNIALGQATGGTGDLTYNGNVDLTNAVRTITINNTNTTFSGIVSNGGLTKSGTGTLTLTGANTYTGTTTINGGTLVLNPATGSALPATNSVEVNSGGTLRITGRTQTLAHLTVNAGGTVIIESTGRLEITGTMTSTGTITNNIGVGGLVIHSGASLIHNNAGVNATMHRNFPNSHHWRLISSPVVEQAITGDWSRIIAVENRGYDFFDWHEANSIWRNQKVGSNNITSFVPGRGYLVSYWIRGGTVAAPTFSAIANLTQTFAGELNNDNVSIGIRNLNTGRHRGFNLVGNPYSSSINWHAVRTNTNNNAVLGSIHAHVWDPTLSNFVIVDGLNAGALIAPNQGFFVFASGASAVDTNLIFNNTMRRHGESFKSEPVLDDLVLRLSQGQYSDNTTLRILEQSQWTRDRYDAAKFFSFSNQVPQLFSQSADQVQLAINSVPQVDQSSEFTLGLRAPATGQYTLSLQTSNGAFDQRDVFVRDLLTGTVHNLRQNPQFTFHAAQGDHAARFKVSFTQPTTVGNLPQGTTAIYVYNNVLHLNFASDESNRQLQVFDISGRVVKSQRLQDGASQSIPLALEMGTYIVRITDSQGVATKRVMVK